MMENTILVPADSWRNAEVRLGAVVLLARRRSRQPGCKASGESQGIIRRGKFTFPLGFSWLSWARSPQTFRHPSAPGGTCLLIPTKLFCQLWVQGPQDPGAGLGARSPQHSLLLGLKSVLENTNVSILEYNCYFHIHFYPIRIDAKNTGEKQRFPCKPKESVISYA